MKNETVYRIKKLTDSSLDCVSGGLPINLDAALIRGGLVALPIGILGSVACSIAGSVYSSKAHKAMQNGDTKNGEKYAKTTKGLTIATATLSSMVPISIGAIAISTVDVTKNHSEIWGETLKMLSNISENKSN